MSSSASRRRLSRDSGISSSPSSPSSPSPTWQTSLGISADISALNLGSFLLHATSSILFLVFLNATQPFLISQLGETRKQGSLSGTLVFSDELLSMFLVLFWGSLADVVGTKVVAVTGYCFVAIALLTYTLAQSPWPDLLFCRLVFAVGGSAVTSMLSGILNSYSAPLDVTPVGEGVRASNEGPSESTSLLEATTGSQAAPSRQCSRHGRLAALTGLMTGVGALIAVFFLLRLPILLASLYDRNAPPELPGDGGDEAVRRGTKEAFYIVSALAALVAIALSFGLKMDKPNSTSSPLIRRESEETSLEQDTANDSIPTTREARRQRLKRRLQSRSSASKRLIQVTRTIFSGIFAGFQLAGKDSSLSLGYLSGGLARACTIATTVFIPLLVTKFFYSSGLCSTLPSPDIPPSELKRTCRQAFTVASILSGVVQLIALLLSPLVGYMCEALSPAWTLFIATSIGTASFLILGLALPNNGDPRSPVAWVAAVGIGFCQIAAIVASLALCARSKSRLRGSDTIGGSGNVVTSVGGSIAGAYSATGGLFILLVSKLGGSLSDIYAPAAFLLLAFMAALTAIVSFVVIWQERKRS
ncbi:hypothetical protein CBS101457_000742 [Exobasidium rhododendri]|nr:hypothetical protein CBS101457_000742 [Exobasidium rhododendri]